MREANKEMHETDEAWSSRNNGALSTQAESDEG